MTPSLPSDNSPNLHISYAKHPCYRGFCHFPIKLSYLSYIFLINLAGPLFFSATYRSMSDFVMGIFFSGGPAYVFRVDAPFFSTIMSRLIFFSYSWPVYLFTNQPRNPSSLIFTQRNPWPFWVAMSSEWPRYAFVYRRINQIIKEFSRLSSGANNSLRISVPNKSGIVLNAKTFGFCFINTKINGAFHVYPRVVSG